MFYVAHRTNSASAAARYAAAGFTHYEVDVRLTAGRVLLGHYQQVVVTRGLLERNNARLRVRGGPPFDVPIEVVLAALAPPALLVIDPKDRDPAVRARLATVLAGLLDDPGRHVVSSRSIADLLAFRAAGFRTWWTLDRPAQLLSAASRPLPADGVTVRQRALSAAAVEALHRVTDTVVAWTVNRPSRAAELAELGVDGITTDAVAVATGPGWPPS